MRVRAIASFLAHLNAVTPPDIDDAVARRRRRRRSASAGRSASWARRPAAKTLRVLPMPVADLVGERFERDELCAAIAARGVLFTAMGPWTAGTAAVLLDDSAGNDGGAAGQTVFAAGGPAELAEALSRAARAFGAEIRTGAEVAAVTTDDDGRATGVALASGEAIPARAVVSSADPKRTLLDMVDPEDPRTDPRVEGAEPPHARAARPRSTCRSRGSRASPAWTTTNGCAGASWSRRASTTSSAARIRRSTGG